MLRQKEKVCFEQLKNTLLNSQCQFESMYFQYFLINKTKFIFVKLNINHV